MRLRHRAAGEHALVGVEPERDRKSTRLNSSHSQISYAVFCLKKKKDFIQTQIDIVRSRGMKTEQFMLDPVIGFTKTTEKTLRITVRLYEFNKLYLTILIGAYR